MADTGGWKANCVTIYEMVGGVGADSMDILDLTTVLTGIGVSGAAAALILEELPRDRAGKVSWRAFLNWVEGGIESDLPSEPLGLRLIKSRHCTQRFDSSKSVPRETVDAILSAAQNVPSSSNCQPWTVIVTQGTTLDWLAEEVLCKVDAGDEGEAQYASLPESAAARAERAAGGRDHELSEGHAGPERGDEAVRRAKHRANCDFGGAPVHLLLCAPAGAVDGVFIDMGSLMTALLLGAHSHGLGAKPLFAVAKYHDVCRKVLGADVLGEDLLVVCGLSIGWSESERDPRRQPGFFPATLDMDASTRWVTSPDWASVAAAPVTAGDLALIRLIETRHCSHCLDPTKAVARDTVASILCAARSVPSSDDSRPWRVTVVQGGARDALSARMLEEFDAGNDGKHQYQKGMKQPTERMKQATDTYGREFYEEHFGLDRADKAGRRLKYRPNYEFWGAPVLLLLSLPRNAVAGTFLDFGSFMYAILLGMHSYGLGGKPQGSVAKYTDVCREVLGSDKLPEDEVLVCGISVGWPSGGRDPRQTPDFYPSRLGVEKTTCWVVDDQWRAT